MRLKDISLVSQGIKQSQNELEEGIKSATSGFDNKNTLAGQAVQQSQDDLKNQINDATSPFDDKNTMAGQAIMQSQGELKNQIVDATSPFDDKNTMAGQAIMQSQNELKKQIGSFGNSLINDVGSLYKNDNDEFSLAKQAMLSKGIKNNRNFMESLSRRY